MPRQGWISLGQGTCQVRKGGGRVQTGRLRISICDYRKAGIYTLMPATILYDMLMNGARRSGKK